MDVRFIFAMATCALIVGDICGSATLPPGTAIPTLYPPTTLAPSFPPKLTKSTVKTTVKATTRVATTKVATTQSPTTPSSTTSSSTTPSSTTQPPPITCNDGACDATVCSNSSNKLPTRTCGPSINNTCITEITVQKSGIKHYVFRCSANTCIKEKNTAASGTEILCCNQPRCNSYEAALGSGSTWWSVNLLMMLSLVTVQMFWSILI